MTQDTPSDATGTMDYQQAEADLLAGISRLCSWADSAQYVNDDVDKEEVSATGNAVYMQVSMICNTAERQAAELAALRELERRMRVVLQPIANCQGIVGIGNESYLELPALSEDGLSELVMAARALLAEGEAK